MRVAGYIRVSTAEQKMHGFSLEAQTRLIESFCEQNGHKLVGIYADEGKSASKQLHRRTEILRLLDDAEAGRVDLIAFKDLTRWSRNPSQFYAVQDRLDRAKVSWISIEQPSLETVTAQGRLLVGITISVAAHESAQTSERIKFVNKSRVVDGGVLSGKVLIGYKIATIDGKKRIVVDEETRRIAEDVFEQYDSSQNLMSVVRMLREKYGIVRYEAPVRKMLHNRKYIGECRGIQGYCEPIIDKDLFDQVQRSLGQHHYHAKKHEYIFSSLIRCAECGNRMVGMSQKDYRYYYCKNVNVGRCTHRRMINETKLEQHLLDHIDEDISRYIVTIEEAAKTKKNPAPIRAKLERLHDLYIDGQISREEHDRRAEPLLADLREMESTKSDAERIRNAFPDGWRKFYTEAPISAKNAAWRSVLEYIEVDDQGGIKIHFA